MERAPAADSYISSVSSSTTHHITETQEKHEKRIP